MCVIYNIKHNNNRTINIQKNKIIINNHYLKISLKYNIYNVIIIK